MHEIYDGSITVVAFFREEVRHALVGFGMRSSSTKILRLLASKEVGSPSSECKLGMSRFSYADCHSP